MKKLVLIVLVATFAVAEERDALSEAPRPLFELRLRRRARCFRARPARREDRPRIRRRASAHCRALTSSDRRR